MDKRYDPHAIETAWYETWEKKNYFSPSGKGDSYTIMLPPPNVTGSLHMGHAFQDTIMDALIRYHRMLGRDTLWQGGTDHAGIATQLVVENILAREGKTRHDLGRDKFVEKVWEWKEESGGTIMGQMRRLGTSVDWSRMRFTMDPGLSEAVKKVFVTLHEEGIIYRGKRLVNWDPQFHTAISDLEVNSEEENGHMWTIKYPRADGKGHVMVSTTRPETMLGDAAVAVHPKDERYQDLIGKKVILPLVGREIPVVADEYVDPEFGTGCVKITPAHDFNDYEVGKRHNLEMINIFTVDAKINDEAAEAYRGMDRFKARKQIVKDLEAQELMEEIKPHKLVIPRGDRSGVVIEPFLTDQWYVSSKVLAEPAMEAVKSGKIKFVPKNWENTYFNWMNEIQDWCISRQLWWGHRIPAWYDPDGNIFVGYDEDDARKRGGIGGDVKLTQDEDVLDTWFSSALWTFATLGWPEQTPELKKYAPSDVLVTGFDIIFFWVARMIMMTLKFMDDVPFHTVFVTGLIRDSQGDKMSKSKGNILDPIDVIDGISIEDLTEKRTASLMQESLKAKVEKATRKEFPKGISPQGTDALRFTFASLAGTGRDIKLSSERIEGYGRFCNKLWNAARYVLMNTAEHDCGADGGELELSPADKWIHSLLQKTIEKVHAGTAEYRFDRVAQALYEFLWNEYCDWYLELSKPLLWSKTASEAQLRGTRHTLVNVLDEILRLSHPLMPYITEEIWSEVKKSVGKDKEETIMLQAYPKYRPELLDENAEREIGWIKEVVTGVRNIRGETGVGPGKALPVFLRNGKDDDKRRLEENRAFMIKLANLEDITWLDNGEEFPAAVQLVGELEVLVPLKETIDRDKELSRLNKEIEKLDKTITALQGKLGNAKFVENAPADIVKVEREKLADQQSSREKLTETLASIKAM